MRRFAARPGAARRIIVVVTQTFPPDIGGMQVLMAGLAGRLALSGRSVKVLANGAPAGADATVPEPPFVLRRFGGWRPLRRWRKRRAIAALLAAGNVEGVFCDSWKSVEALPRRLGVPVAVLAHGAEYPVTPRPRKARRIMAALARCHAIIANSHFTADAVRRFLAWKEDGRVTVIHPPVEALNDPTPEALCRIRARIGERSPVVSTLARLDEPCKGIDSVVAALPHLIERHPSLVFLVGGSGNDQKRLRALARERGVAPHVEFLGKVSEDDKAAMLTASDVFAMPVRRIGSSVEGFGIVYSEAAWFGVPSLGGGNTGAVDAVLDGQTGLLCDGANRADVTAKLGALLDDAEMRGRFGRAAQVRARSELTWDQALPRFLAALGLPVLQTPAGAWPPEDQLRA